MSDFNFKQAEKKWNKYWEDNKTFKTDVWDFSKPKYYVLDMFPYPSGQGLHVGHPEGYTATDIVARFKRMQGFNVLHPMGYDSFGLPAEQYAIKTGNHPDKFTNECIKIFEKQLKMLGFSYDWDRTISTCDPAFYKWTQWIFKQLFEDGLAKYQDMPVNWCEELGTVLSNDEIIDGKSERGGFPVVRKNFKQWVIDTPHFAESLLEGLNHIDWPNSTKEIQRNWIGKSEGVEVEFNLNTGGKFSIFTTCIETICGITFMVMAPESDIVSNLKTQIKNWNEVEKYIEKTAKKSDLERGDLNKDKSGVKLEGVKAINPVNNKEVDIFIADFVIASYGTGAVMAVPSHDQRDFEFALKYNIPMIEVIAGGDVSKSAFEKQSYLGKGCTLVNSGKFDGLTVEKAKGEITKFLEEKGVAKRKINYRLRDWIFARQRYWGEPVPIVHLENGKSVALEDTDLPLVLPEMKDYKGRNGKAPLENNQEWVNVEIDGAKGKRETSTMPGSAGSSWYFLRYIDPKNNEEICDRRLMEHWLPVDLYVGGPEHAVGHLLYSRVWNNYLFNKGIVPVKEPFKKLIHQGMILGENNEKMSKSRGNVVNPDDIVKEFGADTLRAYEMFMGALEDDKPWNTKNIDGVKRFLDRVWRLYADDNKICNKENKNLEKIYHETVKKVTEDYDKLSFNTAISQMMIFINAVYKESIFPKEYAECFIKLLNPIAPYLTEEIWCEILGFKNTIAFEKWPTFVEKFLIEDSVEIAVQVNSKIVARAIIQSEWNESEVLAFIKKLEKVKERIDGKNIVKELVVKGRLVNIIVK